VLALQIAATNEDVETAQELLKGGATVDAVNSKKYGQTGIES
jgi:ankyrin repeat protein